MLHTKALLGASLVGLALATPVLAHDDDPKILDRQPPFVGPAYRAADEHGGGSQAVLGFAANRVVLNSWLTLGQLDGALFGNDCWGYVSGSGREYAIIGTFDSTVFVEVTDPNNAQVVDVFAGAQSDWRDIKTYQNFAYSVTEGGGGIQVFNLTNIDSGSISLVNTVNSPGTGQTHNVAIDPDSGFLYRAGGQNEGLRIYSLANPSNPTFVGSYSDKYVHDVQVVTYDVGLPSEREIAYACGGFNGGFDQTSLIVLDVTNKSNIQTISTVFYPDPAYSHQGWLSEDRQYFYLGDELDENGTLTTRTHVMDVSDPDNAFYVGAFTNGSSAIGHNLYTHRGLTFEANYTSGLRIFNTNADPLDPPEVAFFDTVNGSNAASFNGLWNVYPYLPSGTIIGSDIERGLFVWTVDAVSVAFPEGRPSEIATSGVLVPVRVQSVTPGAVASATLFYSTGGGYTQIPLTAVSGDDYTADFPALPCGTQIEWYVTATTTGTATTTAPASAPATGYLATVQDGSLLARDDTMESQAGWGLGTPNDASSGNWIRANPVGTEAQPEDDHTPSGTLCWVTGNATAGSSVGTNDVDGGSTTLLSPTLDLSGLSDPTISYWRWYSNTAGSAPNADVFEIDISSNGGSSWTSVEVVGPTGAGTSGGWFQKSFRVSDFVTPTNQVRMRFIASDLGSGSIVEAAIDDFQVTDALCDDTLFDVYCTSNPNSTGSVATLEAAGSSVIADNDLDLSSTDVPPNRFGYFLMADSQGFVPNFGGSQGNLCLGAPLVRFAADIAQSTPAGTFDFSPDLTNLPNLTVFNPGETWSFQLWFRDVNPTTTSNTSDAIEITFN